MASFTAGTTFTDGVANDVTAAKLGALVTAATPTSGLIQDRTAETVVGVNDTLLIGDASDSNNLKRMTVANLLKAPLVSTSGTVDNLTTGTTTSTAEIVTSGTITTLNSTTGTITNLSATTSTFLGTITGSTNVINIGSGQIYKDGSGNVGIGTTSPTKKLHVVGPTANGAGNEAILIDANSVQLAVRRESGGEGTIELGTPNNHNLGIFTNGTVGAYFASGGNVGIGTTAPVNNLEIVGSFGRGAPVTKTGDFTLADTENWIIVNKGSTGTATLPAASSWTGREFTIKTIQAFAVVSASSNVIPRIGGAAGTAILPATDGAWATLVSNGSNWEIMCGS